ncbi:hypothetical protein WJX72_003256 [[Myrmecia] bisecta]|uniref:non-specific serine/threonine protein kinase n=1 Tax=[Myrmecia] bisecta TaxID=41462 RepID=A0AAW1QPS8_9CHLO
MSDTGQESPLAIDAERYDRLECIGRGSFGDVYRGWDKELQQEVAIKVIDLEDVEDDIEDIHKEVAVLARCKSNNITEYYASVLKPGSTELLIVMELMATSVADLLEEVQLDEPCLAWILHEVLQALAYLHSEHRIHRDVKAANILLSAQGAVKISDFGVSGQLTGTLGYRRRTFVGTPYWMAPEVIESSEEGYTQTADVWSLGITAIEMALGSPPHADLHPMRVLFLIPKEPSPSLDGPFSRAFKDFVSCCLQKDPSLRPSCADLLQHEFIMSARPAPKLQELIATHAERKPRAETNGMYGATPQINQTMPKWDFGPSDAQGTVKAKASNFEHAHAGSADHDKKQPVGTLKSHQLSNFTVKDGSIGGTVASNGIRSRLQHMSIADVATDEDMSTMRPQHSRRHISAENIAMAAKPPPTPSSRRTSVDDPTPSEEPAIPTSTARDDDPSTSSPEAQAQQEQPRAKQATDSHQASTSDVLRLLLQPALAAAVGHDRTAKAAAAAALDALAALEGTAPGALQATLAEMLRLLSVQSSTSAPSLQSLQETAQGLFGSASVADYSGTVPDVGPLGTFLLNRWKESMAQDRLRHAPPPHPPFDFDAL